MKNLGPASEEEMVIEFLRAELESPRFREDYAALLNTRRLNRAPLIDEADLRSRQDNQARRNLLMDGVRRDRELWDGFPTDIAWSRVELDSAEIMNVRYINWQPWLDLSGGTRLIRDGARLVSDGPTIAALNLLAQEGARNIQAVVKELRNGRTFPALIGVDDLNGGIILVEGHTRATAYAITRLPLCVELVLGFSEAIRSWKHY